LFVIRHPQRDALQQKLTEAGVGTLIHYPVPPHLSGAYSAMRLAPGALPIAEQIANTVLSLPIGPHLTDGQMRDVISGLKSALKSL
jgi:dTDP-4-amino-4,6-dideoxygalactose transaminase